MCVVVDDANLYYLLLAHSENKPNGFLFLHLAKPSVRNSHFKISTVENNDNKKESFCYSVCFIRDKYVHTLPTKMTYLAEDFKKKREGTKIQYSKLKINKINPRYFSAGILALLLNLTSRQECIDVIARCGEQRVGGEGGGALTEMPCCRVVDSRQALADSN